MRDIAVGGHANVSSPSRRTTARRRTRQRCGHRGRGHCGIPRTGRYGCHVDLWRYRYAPLPLLRSSVSLSACENRRTLPGLLACRAPPPAHLHHRLYGGHFSRIPHACLHHHPACRTLPTATLGDSQTAAFWRSASALTIRELSHYRGDVRVVGGLCYEPLCGRRRTSSSITHGAGATTVQDGGEGVDVRGRDAFIAQQAGPTSDATCHDHHIDAHLRYQPDHCCCSMATWFWTARSLALDIILSPHLLIPRKRDKPPFHDCDAA